MQRTANFCVVLSRNLSAFYHFLPFAKHKIRTAKTFLYFMVEIFVDSDYLCAQYQLWAERKVILFDRVSKNFFRCSEIWLKIKNICSYFKLHWSVNSLGSSVFYFLVFIWILLTQIVSKHDNNFDSTEHEPVSLLKREKLFLISAWIFLPH